MNLLPLDAVKIAFRGGKEKRRWSPATNAPNDLSCGSRRMFGVIRRLWRLPRDEDYLDNWEAYAFQSIAGTVPSD